MEKIKIGSKQFLYPMPTTLVGANVNGKPNFLTIAWCGIVGQNPAMISISLSKDHFTTLGIKQNGTFSVNIPSTNMVEVTDYCGIVSGKKVDKASSFKVFYGELGTAPMIMECPINLECKVARVIDDLNEDDIFIGEIVEAYSEDKYMTNGRPDVIKIDPIIFSTADNNYWKVGMHLGRAWDIGKKGNGANIK